jgi:hypothetical protein
MTIPRPIHGKIFAASGLLHIIAGFLPSMYGRELLSFARDGFFNTLPHQAGPSAIADHAKVGAFSWVLVGVAFMVVGDLVDHLEKKNLVPPMRFVWTMLFVAVVTSIMMPASGFLILMLPQTIFLLYRSWKRS